VTQFLLDVNVLIALVRRRHEHHTKVRRWFGETAAKHWVTCPLTEAGFVRIASNPRFTEPALDVSEVLAMLAELTGLPGHEFWPIDLSFTEAVSGFEERFFGHQQVTDTYLLALAVRNQGKLVTLDRGAATIAGERYNGHVVLL
jgi:toxin-antitoxin system PIN domain toxin